MGNKGNKEPVNKPPVCNFCLGSLNLLTFSCNHHICNMCFCTRSIIKNGFGHIKCNDCKKDV
jgi:hypothetical protein